MPRTLVTYGANYGVGRVYDAFLGPRVRQAVQRLFRQPYSKPFVPPNTPGTIARDLTYGALAYVVGKAAFATLLRQGKVSGAPLDPLLTSGGMAGAGAGAALSSAGLMGVVWRSFAMTAVFTALDGVFAVTAGPKVETLANRVFGVKAPVGDEPVRGGVPLNRVRMTFEQGTRNFARSFAGGLTMTLAMRQLGAPVAARVLAHMGTGTLGVLSAALASSLLAMVASGVLMSTIGQPLADAAQGAARLGKRALGVKLDEGGIKDVIPTPGDGVNGALRGVFVPFGTALLTGRQDAFLMGLGAGKK